LPDDIEIIVPEKGTDEELLKLVEDVEIIVSSRLSADVAKAAKRLKLLQKTGAGVDAMPFKAIGKDVFMANTSGADPVPLAEGVVALVLSLAKRIVLRHNLFPGRDDTRGVELRGKKVGIIGLGHIGIEVAKRLQAFDMKILGLKRRLSEAMINQLNLEFLGPPDDLDHLLKESDFVVITVPLTPATRGLIGKRELQLMKPTAYLVNVGRAAIIEEEPLYLALKEGWIAGAGLDVWWIPHWWDPNWNPEIDKPSNFPIWELPNVIGTPHNVGSIEKAFPAEAALRIIAENIRRTTEGKPPINQVDMEHQY
jgi:phosphoglycerate dehydrogenase-like enzyme